MKDEYTAQDFAKGRRNPYLRIPVIRASADDQRVISPLSTTICDAMNGP